MSKVLLELRRKLAAGRQPVAASDEQFQGNYPALFDWLTITTVGKEPRQTGTLNMFMEGGMFKAFLNDRDTGCYACVSASSVAELLARADAAISDSSFDWRAPRASQGPRKKGR